MGIRMKRKQTLKQKAWLFLAGLVSLLPGGCGLPSSELHGLVKTSVQPYVSKAGFIVNKKLKRQDLVSARYGNFSAYAWQSQEPRELDVGLRYNHEFNERLSGWAGPVVWTYPGKDNPLGTRDVALEGGLNWQAP